MNIICFGDSITQAADQAEGDRWPTVLQIKLNAWSPASYRVYNRGVSGHTTSQAFERFKDDVRPLLPGIVLVQFGLNDAKVREWFKVPRIGLEEYEKNLKEFHRAIRERGGRDVFIVNHRLGDVQLPQGNGRTLAENVEPYNDAVKALARELKAPYIDLPQIMVKHRVILKQFLAADGIHLSTAGNHMYANMVFGILAEILKGSANA